MRRVEELASIAWGRWFGRVVGDALVGQRWMEVTVWCSYIAACTSVMQECLSLLRLAKTGAESRLSHFALGLKGHL